MAGENISQLMLSNDNSSPSSFSNDSSDHSQTLPYPQPLRSTTFLTVGQVFSGSQTVNNNSNPSIPSTSSPLSTPFAIATAFANTVAPITTANEATTNDTTTAANAATAATTVGTVSRNTPVPSSVVASLSLASSTRSKESNEWRVNVTIQSVDLENGTVSGSMEALDVPRTNSPVVTFWTGEIIDNINYFFHTGRWGAHIKKDIEHWRRFRAFAPYVEYKSDSLDRIDLSQSRHIFMRWKEIFFVSPGEDCGLTIAGFYYVCIDRHTGAILGYYYDPKCQPFQMLSLRPVSTRNGFAFGDYDFN